MRYSDRPTDGTPNPEPPSSSPKPCKTLGGHFCAAWRDSRAWRPVSAYLLLAIFLVTLLGVQYVHVREDPRRFASFLILLFVFFFMVIVRAIVDCIEILRRGARERRLIFRKTLGDEQFVSELGKRIAGQLDR